jgi:hypothetical protein
MWRWPRRRAMAAGESAFDYATGEPSSCEQNGNTELNAALSPGHMSRQRGSSAFADGLTKAGGAQAHIDALQAERAA